MNEIVKTKRRTQTVDLKGQLRAVYPGEGLSDLIAHNTFIQTNMYNVH